MGSCPDKYATLFAAHIFNASRSCRRARRTTHNAQHTTRCCPAVTGELFISRKRVVCPWQQQRALTPKCCLKCCAAAKEKTQAWLEGRGGERERSPRSTRQCGDLLSSLSPHGADRVSSYAATALAQLLTRRAMPAAGKKGVAGVPQTRKEMRDNTHVSGFPFSSIDFMHKSSPQMLIYNLYAGKA